MPGPPYKLYLIRHGVAADRGEKWPDDTKRPLTEEGIERMRKAARGMERLGVRFDIVITSPLVRTRQTAELVAAAFDPRPHIVNSESLAPGGTHASIIAELQKYERRSHIGIVGHEPGIGELAARLIGARHVITFKKGSVCRIDVDALPPNGPGDLRWFLTPRTLRSIKKV
jgi:phosphohistidine phosphatase